jgi:hypothetical protein
VPRDRPAIDRKRFRKTGKTMNSNHGQSRRRRILRPELLESRELLSAIGLKSTAAADVSPLVKKPHTHTEKITGALGGSATPVSTASQGTEILYATGTTTVLGAATFNGSVTYKDSKTKVKYTGGTATLSNGTGSGVTVSFSGSGKDVSSSLSFVWKGSVTGGTETLSGATGTVHAKGSLDPAKGTFTISSLTVKLTRT